METIIHVLRIIIFSSPLAIKLSTPTSMLLILSYFKCVLNLVLTHTKVCLIVTDWVDSENNTLFYILKYKIYLSRIYFIFYKKNKILYTYFIIQKYLYNINSYHNGKIT